MGLSSSFLRPLTSISGSRPVRRLANAGFHAYGSRRTRALGQLDPVAVQRNVLLDLVARARRTRFGRDHHFQAITSVAEFQNAVPLRTYEQLWNDYLKDQYPIFDNLTWPGRIPWLALTSGTTQGATKYIPVSHEMVASNTRAALTMIGAYLASRPASRLFDGKLFFLGGSTDLEQVARGVRQGDLSGVASITLNELLRPYTFPPLELALETDWETKLDHLAARSLVEPITLVSGVPSWLLVLFERVLARSGKSTMAEAWPHLEIVIHGGVKFDPYRDAFRRVLGSDSIHLQESYPCSEGFVAYGDIATDHLRLLFDHGLFYEFVPVDELDSPQPSRHWLGTIETGVNYAIVVSTCAGMWAHVIGDTVRFESRRPPLLTFTGRTKYTLSAFGEHLISEEVEHAITAASKATGASVRDWHVGPVFQGALGYHQYVVEFMTPPSSLHAFRQTLDASLCDRNADYKAHRADGVGLPLPEVLVASPGTFDDWMRSRGKLGGQNKVPRMDNSGTLTSQLVALVRERQTPTPPGA